jgi:hypothetical protein
MECSGKGSLKMKTKLFFPLFRLTAAGWALLPNDAKQVPPDYDSFMIAVTQKLPHSQRLQAF